MKSLLNFHINNRDSFARIVFGYFLILLLYRFHSSTFLVYAYGQPMKGPELDYTFWLSLCSGFPHYILQHYWACIIIDLAVVFFSIACLVSDKYRYLFCRLLIIFFFMQRITIETYACAHSKSMSAVFIALLPFCMKKERDFDLVMEFARYFLVFVMVSSAYHKFSNGLLFSPQNFVNVLISQHSDLATLNPQHICYRMASHLITHPKLAALSYLMLFFSQAIFIIGFFTRRIDKILFLVLVIFAIMTYFIMRIYNLDITILGLTLIYFSNYKKTEI